MGDEHKGITKLADHFKVEHNRCIYHKTSKKAAITARRGHIDINAALRAAAGRISICRTALPCLPSSWRIILSG